MRSTFAAVERTITFCLFITAPAQLACDTSHFVRARCRIFTISASKLD